ncbi:TetR/AcrR family transcriptional regulator [Saccharopolyspora terrae]|uniref:TetR/AcrR family transcriptional regulator n=1 Tax=Saccharopolyspora terrae TaxID=2530384 RepID=A0A4R4VKQ7_9PSEU|nr:TetR/AcrR family transcriptional regulator [Saccharopolyspora terrae]TDD02894.1 TetR/AcrR family transcriptional regulator [Saccharopolyspora terrae]
MTELSPRERARAATEQDIRRHARTLLVERGSDAVTLRAIARELGITAPALYRYYASREDLLRQLCDDICADLSEELSTAFDPSSEDFLDRTFAVCRRFRAWALAHPKEFALVFATPKGLSRQPDRFAGVFLSIVAPMMSENPNAEEKVKAPVDLPDLSVQQKSLADAFSHEGIDMPPEAMDAEAVYFLMRWWVRLYGHIALEVFGRFPFDLFHADQLFDAALHELAAESGLT